MHHVAAAAAVLALSFLLPACASDDGGEERAQQTGEAVGGNTKTYTCSAPCSVDANRCSCIVDCSKPGTPNCKNTNGWEYYYWDPCPGGQHLYCNAYGSCWCQ